MNIKNEKGITLVALIVSIIIMIILATVTLTTTFTAYDTTKAQKFKSQMRVLQEGVNSCYSDWQSWTKEKEIEYRDMLRNKEVEIGNAEKNILQEKIKQINSDAHLTVAQRNAKIAQIKQEFYEEYNISEEMKLKENTELPEYFYNNFAGIKQYLEYKKSKEKYVYEIKGEKISTLKTNAVINEECFVEVDKKMKELLGEKYDEKQPNTLFYKFDEADIEYFFGIKDIDLPIYINFENLIIFTTKPVRLNGENIYTLYSFDDQNEIILNDTKSTMEGASILVDVKANYGTSQKITLTLESYEVGVNENKNNYVDYRIRKAYYQNIHTQTSLGSTDLLKGAAWHEVDDLKECEYSEDGKSVSFIVYESGLYKFRLEDVSGAYTTQMKKNTKVNVKNPTNQYGYEKIEAKDTNGDGKPDQDAGYNITLCNAPVLNPDMVPVKWVYDDDSKVNGKWVVCTTIDPEWYNYSEDAKMWANVMLVHDTKAKNLSKGTELFESEMGSMFVWVPRYAKSTGMYTIKFMRGTSSTNTYGNEIYAGNTANAYDGFGNNSSDGWDVKLRGLWFAKYDTSIEAVDTQQSINTSEKTQAELCNKLYSVGQNFKPTIKPYRITWRNISFTSAFSQSLMFYTNLPSASKSKDINSHMMTKYEFDVLNNFASNDKYGVGKDSELTPKLSHNTSNKYAGGSDGHGGYTVANFRNQSTNGNMTGVFDFEGTTNVMISEISTAYGENKSDQLLNSLGDIINKKDETDYSNKYIEILDSTNGTIRIEEEPNNSAMNYQKVEDCISNEIGFRIVITNSPAGDRSNFIYTAENLINTDASLPGFYITDENGDYIKNNNGEFKDTNGESTYISWDEMINRRWIKIEKGNDFADYANLYKPEDRLVVMGENADGWKKLQGIWVISDDVNIIGRDKVSEADSGSDFGYRQNLLEVQMSDTITEISATAFQQCKNLESVKLSENLIKIGSSAFWNCAKLVNISLPESLERIEEGAFHHCSSLESITIPINVEKIGINAFANCTNVTNLEILSNNNLVIEEYAFLKLNKVKQLKIPNSVKEIKPSAFSTMSSLENLELEDGIQIIGEGAFSGCSSLTKVVLPKSVKSISLHTNYATSMGEYGLFEGCTNLVEVDMSKTQIQDLQNDTFYSCGKLKKVKLPPTLKNIGKDCFRACNSLSNLELPNTIEKIRKISFWRNKFNVSNTKFRNRV
ncbi:MAG: leucine-rich repeat domain-containing protein [Clostridia bacterium]|nr:leucine-rich repeat domain-containing protein [Clostridia bacterium]